MTVPKWGPGSVGRSPPIVEAFPLYLTKILTFPGIRFFFAATLGQ